MHTRTKAVIGLVSCSVLWSTSGLFIRLIDFNPFVITGLRGLLASFLMLAFLKPRRLVVNRESVVAGLILCASMTLFIVANRLTTSANAIMLQYISPVFTLFFSAAILKTRIRRKDVAVVLATTAGMVLFFLDELSPGYFAGNILAILAGVGFAAINVYCAMAKNDTMCGIYLGQLFAFFLSIPFLFLYPPHFTAANTGAILFLGFVQLGIPYILFSVSMRHATPLDGSLLTALEPILNPVWVLIFLHTAPGVYAVLGGIVVIGAVTLWSVSDSRKAMKQEKQKL